MDKTGKVGMEVGEKYYGVGEVKGEVKVDLLRREMGEIELKGMEGVWVLKRKEEGIEWVGSIDGEKEGGGSVSGEEWEGMWIGEEGER